MSTTTYNFTKKKILPFLSSILPFFGILLESKALITIATNIQMAILPKVRSALCAASQLPGKGPTGVEDAAAPAS